MFPKSLDAYPELSKIMSYMFLNMSRKTATECHGWFQVGPNLVPSRQKIEMFVCWALFLLGGHLVFQKYDFWKAQTPEKCKFEVMFDHFNTSAPMSMLFWGTPTTTRCVALRQIWDTWPLPSHPGTEYLVRVLPHLDSLSHMLLIGVVQNRSNICLIMLLASSWLSICP